MRDNSRLRHFLIRRRTNRRLHVLFIFLIVQLVLYTIIVHETIPFLEGVYPSWTEALFFVIMTITTVGYTTLFPTTSSLTLMLFSVIMVTGVFTVLMAIPIMIAPYLSELLQSTLPSKTPRELSGHVVIIGSGGLAQSLIESLMISNLPVVLVEEEESAAREFIGNYGGNFYVVQGSYSDHATWDGVWIKNARNIIILEDERTTATIILGIREYTQGQIIAVVDDLSFDRYLRYAGAEYVLSPKNFTGRILARHTVLRPEVDTIYEAIAFNRLSNGEGEEDTGLKLIKVPIMAGCRCAGKTLAELSLPERYGIVVLFFWRGGRFYLNPRGTDTIDTSTMLFLLGKSNTLAKVLAEEFIAENTGEEFAVIAGYGDVGKSAYSDLAGMGINCVVIDPGSHAVTGVTGRAEHEPVLRDAHIEDARFLIVAINDDTANIFTTLIARNMNPGLRILARANKPSSVDKLYRAGADYVALLPTIGGQVLAGIILADEVQIILDLPNSMKVVMKHIMHHTPTTVEWLERKSGVRVLGLESERHSVVMPGQNEPIYEGDAVIVLGDISQLKTFIRLL